MLKDTSSLKTPVHCDTPLLAAHSALLNHIVQDVVGALKGYSADFTHKCELTIHGVYCGVRNVIHNVV